MDAVSSKSAPCELAQGHHTSARTILGRWLREPLVHFLVIGSLLFVIYGALGHSSAAGKQTHRADAG